MVLNLEDVCRITSKINFALTKTQNYMKRVGSMIKLCEFGITYNVLGKDIDIAT